MNRINRFLLIFVCFLIVQCEENKEIGFVINGKISENINDYIYLKYDNILDSILVKEGLFKFSGQVKEPLEAYLSRENPTSKAMVNLALFMLENSPINISLSYSQTDFRGTEIKLINIDSIHGSKSQRFKDVFDLKMTASFHKEKNDSVKAIVLYDNLYEFITVNPRSVLSGKYLAVYNNRNEYLKSSQIENLFKLVDTSYQKQHDLKYIKNLINRRKVLDFGNIYPKIVLPNLEDQLVDSKTLNGKYVLLEFWASWCGPCRKANPALKEVYKKHKEEGFEILGISQDKIIEDWKMAIKEDDIDWIQVIDTTNATSEMYYINTIPYNVLVNKNGEVIERNIKPAALDELLSEKL